MKILVTGAKGFVGKNLCAELKNIRDGKARCYGDLAIEDIFEYDIDSNPEDLDSYCQQCDFVFNLACVNRPQNQEEFMQGNFGFASILLDTLKKHKNTCPVMLSSSQQASLTGRFGNSEYGRSKKAGEELFFNYAEETGAKVLVYRFPNLFGKWCRPNYNSAVATFCNNIANELPIQVNDPTVELELLYIDDLVAEMIGCLKGEEHRCEYVGLTPIPFPKRKGGMEIAPMGVHTAIPDTYGLMSQYSKEMRHNPTEAEDVLWHALKANGIGYKFRRQHVIRNYIVDFFCNEVNLTIELDGAYHFAEEQMIKDDLRRQQLNELGYTEIRFTNEQVLHEIEDVVVTIKTIADAIKVMMQSQKSTDTLNSLPFREGLGVGCRYCCCPITHKITLGAIVDLLHQFKELPNNLTIPEIPAGSFAKKLYSTFLSYLPKEKAVFDLKMNCDQRGSFTELIHTHKCGQVSINISKPGITKGQHWHHTKWEQFIVVSGHGLIQQRNENDPDGEVLNFEVSGDKIQSVIMLPGYTHNIINLSDTEDLVTVMYCNEIFDPNKPDTFFDPVE